MSEGRTKRGRSWVVALLFGLPVLDIGQTIAQEPNPERGLMSVGLFTYRDQHEQVQHFVRVRGVKISLVKRQSSTPPEGPFEDSLSEQIGIADASFDEVMFDKVSNITDARARLLRRLRANVESVDRVCRLTDAQKQKLKLAGRGDIKRLSDRIEDLRERLQSRYFADENGRQLEAMARELSRIGSPLRREMELGPFGDGSLFAKTLRTLLTPDQAAEYAQGRLRLPAAQTDGLPDLSLPR
jgi:hypothetical protein